MKKYIDISNEIKDQFKAGIQILDDVSNDIQEFLTLLQNSSGDNVELIKNDLTFLKDKYTTIKEKVEKRSSEIEERANTYDACLEPYIEKMNNGTLIDRSIDYHYMNLKEKKIVEVQGPEESEDGLGYYKVRTSNVDYILGKKVFEDPRRVSYDVYKIDGMLDFTGGLWNASDYSMNSITIGVNSISSMVSSNGSNSGTGDFEYTSNLWGKVGNADDKPIEITIPGRGEEAATKIKEVYAPKSSEYIIRTELESRLERDGYNYDEIQYAMENAGIDWKYNAVKYAQLLHERI